MKISGYLALVLAAVSMLALPGATIATTNIAGPASRFAASGKSPDNTGVFAGRGATGINTGPFVVAASSDPQPECPASIMHKCHFIPAAYQQDDPNDKSNYGNYDIANRPANGLIINSIIIHDTEGSLASTLAEFQDPTAYVSAHYVIDADGSVYQMVQTKNIAWHAGNWYINQHSIGIEHVGFAASGRTNYTTAMYNSSAELVRYLSAKYNVPLDREHILGHDNVSAPTSGLVAGMHTDPGPFWNWSLYLSLLNAHLPHDTNPAGNLVTITPIWPINKPTVTTCTGTACTALPTQPANFVYLHTAPDASSPLLSDPALHPDNAAGTTAIDDWSAKAVYGQRFAVADRQGDWVAIWFGGQKGWFLNPYGRLAATPAGGSFITPRSGLTSIPVYGRAYPEASAYVGTQVPVQSVVRLQYTINAGQNYATTNPVPTDYFWAWTIDSSLPDDHTLIIGHNHYLEIQFNGRTAYVDAADVTATP